MSDTLFSESGNAFRTAVLVQWPRDGVWTVAFITGQPSGEVAGYLRDEIRQCLCAHHAQPDQRLLRAHAQRATAWSWT